MRNFFRLFNKFLNFCKLFSSGLVNALGNVVRPGPVPACSDLHVGALALSAEAMCIDSECFLFHLIKSSPSLRMPLMLSRRGFNHRRKFLTELIDSIRSNISQRINSSQVHFCVDSTPVPVCRNSRAGRSKMATSDQSFSPNWGFCAAQQSHYFGFKLHSVCSLDGVIHDFQITPASVHDVRYLPELKGRLKSNCVLLGDRGYISAAIQPDLFESCQIELKVPPRKNQKHQEPLPHFYARSRKRIETVFSQLKGQFMLERNYAKSTMGLLCRISSKLAAMVLLQFDNFKRGRPIGKVKAAVC